jgi:hypothetical protein
MGSSEAGGYLTKARRQWDRAAVASYAPAEPDLCVTLAFYAYENAIVAVAEAISRRWTKNHYEKADLAAALARDGIVKTDVRNRLLELNALRKDISYGIPGPDLSKIDLEDLVASLESFLDEVEQVLRDRAGK